MQIIINANGRLDMNKTNKSKNYVWKDGQCEDLLL